MAKASNGEFDVTEYAGVISKGQDDSDSAGRFGRQPTHAVQLVVKEGRHGAYYSTLIGWPWMNPSATIIKLLAEAEKFDGSGWELGRFEVTIRGNRLQAIFDQVCESKRLSVKVSGQVAGEKPEVLAVEIVQLKERED